MNWGKKLGSNELKRGDVLLLGDLGEFTHLLIGLGESTLSHGRDRHASIVHAGLYDGGRALLEASGEGKGLRSGAFANKDADYKFLVYRYTDEDVAHVAAYWAELLIMQRDDQEGGFGHYSIAGAFSSMRHRSSLKEDGKALSDKLQKWAGNYYVNAAKGRGTDQLEKIKAETALYCSGFVVQCFLLATPRSMPPAINLDYRYVSPKRLQGELGKGGPWRHVGYIKAGEI